MFKQRRIIIPEENLVALLQSKDNHGFSILYDNYSLALYLAILKIVKSEEIAFDVMQDSFVKIWKNIDSYNPSKGTLHTWILNIARHAAIDKTRSRDFINTQRNCELNNAMDVVDNQQYTNFDAIGLEKILSQLRPEYQQVINLLYFQGYTHSEVANELDMPLGTIKSRVRNAIKQLRLLFFDI